MALDALIPEIWSTNLQANLDASLVALNLVNRDYEGEIQRAGDTVRIHRLGNVTVVDYARNTDLPAPEIMSVTEQVLVVDQQKAIHIFVDDIDEAQSNIKQLDERFTRRAAFALAEVIDKFIFAKYVDAPASNTIGTDDSPVTLTTSNIYSTFTKARRLLAEKNVNTNNLVAFVSPTEVDIMTQTGSLRETELGDEFFRQGFTGFSFAGFRIFETNNLSVVPNSASPPVNVRNVIFGTRDAITFAQQITRVEPYRYPFRFGDAVKALNVYGAKTIEPNALGVIKVNADATGA